MLYDIIDCLLKFIEKNNNIVWQKVLGLESLSELFKNHIFLFGLYKSNKSLYEKMLINFTEVTYKTFMLKSKSNSGVYTPEPAGGLGLGGGYEYSTFEKTVRSIISNTG